MLGLPLTIQLAAMFLFSGTGVGVPLGVPPQPVDPNIEQAAPDTCLIYLSWVESAEPESESDNRLERLLADVEVQQLIKVLWNQLDEGMKKFADRDKTEEAKALAALVPEAARQLLDGPGAIYLSSFKLQGAGFDVDAGLMLGVGEDGPKVVKLIDQFLVAITRAPPKHVQIDGIVFHRSVIVDGMPPLTWGMHRGYLLFGVGESAIANSLKRMKTGVPTWLTEVAKQLPVKKRSTLTYVNVEGGIKVLLSTVLDADAGTAIAKSGLQNVTHYASISGQDGEEMITRTVLGVNGKRTGFLAVLGDRSLEMKDLERIPANSAMAIAFRLDAVETVGRFISTMGQLEPRAVQEIEEMFEELQDELNGYGIKKDLLPALGDVWMAHASLDEGSFLSGWVFTVKVKDRAVVQRGLEQILASIQRVSERDRQRGRPEAVRKLAVAGQQVYCLSIPDDDFVVVPTWCLNGNELVFTLFPQAMRSYLKRKVTTKRLTTLPQVARVFEEGRSPVFVQYTDTRELFQWLYPFAQIGLNQMFTQLQREGIDVDMSILPSAGTIQQQLGPTVTAWYLQEDGLYADVRQSVPGIGASNLMWVQGMMFFWISSRTYNNDVFIGDEQPKAIEEDVPRR